jgi:uncharacterized protein DUF4129
VAARHYTTPGLPTVGRTRESARIDRRRWTAQYRPVPESRHVTWLVLGASFVVGLAALVRMADPAGADADITGAIRLPLAVTATIGALFGLAAVVFLAGLALHMRRARRHEDDEVAAESVPERRAPWLQLVTQLASLANFVIVAYLLAKHVLPLADLMGQGAGAAGAMAPEPAPDAPFFVTWTFAGLALVAGSAALGLALWFAAAGRLARWFEHDEEDPVPPPLAEAVEESLEDLRGETDARRAITRCFARFERAAAAAGLERRAWQTQMEFMHAALSRLPAPPAAVRRLTALFELARFSDRPLGTAERDRAVSALDDIKAAIEEVHRDAVAR